MSLSHSDLLDLFLLNYTRKHFAPPKYSDFNFNSFVRIYFLFIFRWDQEACINLSNTISKIKEIRTFGYFCITAEHINYGINIKCLSFYSFILRSKCCSYIFAINFDVMDFKYDWSVVI